MKKELIPTLIGILLPVILILTVTVYVFVSQRLVNPQHDFVFTAEDEDYCTKYMNHLVVKTDGSIKKESNTKTVTGASGQASAIIKSSITAEDPYNPCQDKAVIQKDAADVYRYNFQTGKIAKVTEEQYLKYTLQTGSSPEGYQVGFSRNFDSYYYGPAEIFGGGDSNGIFLRKGKVSKKLDVSSFDGSVRPYNFRIMGWVTAE